MHNLFQRRRSIRKYLNKEVPDKKIKRILEAARWAPSAHNAQPWRFLVIKDASIKKKLAKAMAKKWKKDLSFDGVIKKESKDLILSSIKRFSESPILILVCLTMKDMKNYKDKRRKRIEFILALQSISAAIENILLAAILEDLGACWFCAPLFCQQIVMSELKLPKELEPQALITIGYFDKEPKAPNRLALRDIIL